MVVLGFIIDGASACLNRDDQQELEKAGTAAKNSRQEFDSFRTEWTQFRNVVMPPEPIIPVAKAKAKAKAKVISLIGHGVGYHIPREIPAGELSQSQVAHLNPPGGSIWRANKKKAWMSHMPPWPRHSALFATHGHRQAALNCVADNWRKYLDLQGLGHDQCPVEGLLQGQDVLPEASAPSSTPSASAAGGS